MASGNTLAELLPLSSEFPAANGAEIDARNSRPVLDFDPDNDEDAIFTKILPDHYAGGGFTLHVFYAMSSAEVGDVLLKAAIERIGTSQDIDSDSFAPPQSASASTVPATSGVPGEVAITFTNAQIDGLVKGELYRVKITRDADDAADTAAGDLEFIGAEIRET